MVPIKKITDLISKHALLETELSSGQVDKKLFAEKSKEYSDLNEIIKEAKEYESFEKAVLEESNQSVLLAEEKYILDSRKEMAERKETILSGILNGKPHSLDNQ